MEEGVCSDRSIPSISSINRILRDRNLFGPGPLSPELKLKLEASLMRSTSSDDDDHQRSDAGDRTSNCPADSDHNDLPDSDPRNFDRVSNGTDAQLDVSFSVSVSASADCSPAPPAVSSLLFDSRSDFAPNHQYPAISSSRVGLERHVSAPPPNTDINGASDRESTRLNVSNSVPSSPAPTSVLSAIQPLQPKTSEFPADQQCAPLTSPPQLDDVQQESGGKEASPTQPQPPITNECVERSPDERSHNQFALEHEALAETVPIDQQPPVPNSCIISTRTGENTDAAAATASAAADAAEGEVSGMTPAQEQEHCTTDESETVVPNACRRGVLKRLLFAARGIRSSEEETRAPAGPASSPPSREPQAHPFHFRRGSRKRPIRFTGLRLSSSAESQSLRAEAKRTRSVEGAAQVAVNGERVNTNDNAVISEHTNNTELPDASASAHRTHYLLLGGVRFPMRKLATNEWALDAATILHSNSHTASNGTSPSDSNSNPVSS